jgi:DMSO/TMAO reductase YedYZ molybdopterin-dependent catalytic subunit
MKVVLDPSGFYRRISLLPHQLTQPVTPVEDMIVLCHLGVPRLDEASWRLSIDGMVEAPRVLTFADLRAFPFVRLESVHQCAGSPLEPAVPTRRVCNVVWGGVRLADVFAAAKPHRDASFIWSFGADYGSFAGETCDAYVKDLPLTRLRDDVLLAFELNGEPLPAENGYPVRLVVPGYYGTNSVKWLTRLHLARTRAPGPFTTRWYNDVQTDADGTHTSQPTPVWALAPEAIIVSPAPGQSCAAGRACTVGGWAWADGGVRQVDVTADGETWHAAQLQQVRGRSWQAFSWLWVPDTPGPVTLSVRATDHDGVTQPAHGARNAIHSVAVVVAGPTDFAQTPVQL